MLNAIKIVCFKYSWIPYINDEFCGITTVDLISFHFYQYYICLNALSSVKIFQALHWSAWKKESKLLKKKKVS